MQFSTSYTTLDTGLTHTNLQALLSDLVQYRPKESFQHVVSLPRDRREWLLPIVLTAWAKRDPQVAYTALTELNYFDQSSLGQTILREWASIAPRSLLEQIDAIPRTERNRTAKVATTQLTKQSPALMQEILSNWIEIPGVKRNELYREFIRYWSKQSPNEAYKWVVESVPNDGEEQAYMLSYVLAELSHKEPARALNIALAQPESSYYSQNNIFFGGLISTLGVNGHTDLLISSLEKIPAKFHMTTVGALARHLVAANRWDDAIELQEKLSNDLRAKYFEKFAVHGLNHNVTELINRLDALPSDDIRLTVVQTVLTSNQYSRSALTDEQLINLQAMQDKLLQTE